MSSLLAFALQPGTVAGWLTLALLVYGLVIFRHGGGGTALDSLETANRVLERDLATAKATAKTHEATISALQASRDFTAALEPIAALVLEHQRREEAQFAQIASVLEKVARQLDSLFLNGNHAA